MNPYAYTDYRKAIKAAIEVRKTSSPGFTASRLAEQAGIQRSYLSNVLAGRADLNSDQLYLLAEQLGFQADEYEYLQLLLEIDRCALKKRKDQLVARRDQLRGERQRSEEYLERKAIAVPEAALVDYFSNPFCSIVHIFMTIEEYRKDPGRLKARLGMSDADLADALGVLERCAIIRATKKGFEVDESSRHLSQSSRLSRVYATSFRLKAIEYQQRLGNPEDYFFTSTFSANLETRDLIKARFMELLKWIGTAVSEAKSEEVFHMNFDLFRI